MKLVDGKYLHDFLIRLSFTAKGFKFTTIKDFLPLFQKYVKGSNIKYFAPTNFKKFIVRNGNIYWGKDEDVIFPTSMLLEEKNNKDSEEVLYII